MPALVIPKPITFLGADRVTITLPDFLFYQEDAASKSISPVATFDPAKALSAGKDAWQSATSPSRQLNKKTIIIDRAFVPHRLTAGENIALIERLRAAGFEIVLCSQGNPNSFTKVDDQTDFAEAFENLGRFNQDKDFAALGKIGVPRDKAIFLNPDLKFQIFSRLVKNLQFSGPYHTEMPETASVYLGKDGAVFDEMCYLFDYVSDEEIEAVIKELKSGTYNAAKSEFVLMHCSDQQAKKLLERFFRDGVEEEGYAVLRKIQEMLMYRFPELVIKKFPELERISQLPDEEKLTAFDELAKASPQMYFFIQLIPVLEEQNCVRDLKRVERRGSIGGSTTLLLLKRLLELNPTLAKSTIESWPQNFSVRSDVRHELESLLKTYPQIIPVFLKKVAKDDVRLMGPLLKYMPIEEAEDWVRHHNFLADDKDGLRFFYDDIFRPILESTRKSFSWQFVEKSKEKMSIYDVAFALKIFPEKKAELMKLFKEKMALHRDNVQWGEIFNDVPEIFDDAEFGAILDESLGSGGAITFYIPLIQFYQKKRPYELSAFMERVKKAAEKNPKFSAFVKSTEFHSCSFFPFLYKPESFESKLGEDRKTQTLLFVKKINHENLGIFAARRDDFEKITTLRILEIDSVETFKEMLPFLPKLRHITLPEAMRKDLEDIKRELLAVGKTCSIDFDQKVSEDLLVAPDVARDAATADGAGAGRESPLGDGDGLRKDAEASHRRDDDSEDKLGKVNEALRRAQTDGELEIARILEQFLKHRNEDMAAVDEGLVPDPVEPRGVSDGGPEFMDGGIVQGKTGPLDIDENAVDDESAEIADEGLKGQGEIGGDEILTADDGAAKAPKPPELDHASEAAAAKEGKDEDEPVVRAPAVVRVDGGDQPAPKKAKGKTRNTLAIMRKAAEKFFEMGEVSDETLLTTNTVKSDKNKILVVTSAVEKHANHFLRTAIADGRKVFYIDSPDKIDFDRLIMRLKAGGDGSILASISRDGLLEEFFREAATDSTQRPLLLVNWQAFSPKQRLALNTLLDDASKAGDKRTLAGNDVPENIQVIGVSATISRDPSFLSRHDTCLFSKIDNFPLPEVVHAGVAEQIDLQGFPDWRKALFGRLALRGDKTEWEKSRFVNLLESGATFFEVSNISQESAQALRYEIDQAKAKGYLEYHGHRLPLLANFVLNISRREFDFDVLTTVSGSLKTNVVYANVPSKTYTINTHLFDTLIQNKKIEDGHYEETLGLIEQHRNKTLKLFITTELSESQWYCLLRQAEEKNVKLEIYAAPLVSVPSEVAKKLPGSPALVPLVAAAVPSKPRLIVSNDPATTLGGIGDDVVVIDVEDSSYQDLVESLDFEITGGKTFSFSKVRSAILERLLAGEKVVLKGKFAPDLIQFLHPLFISADPDFTRVGNNLTVIIEDDSLTASSKARAHPQLAWLAKDAYEIDFVAAARKAPALRKIVAEKHDFSGLDDESEKKSERFIAERKSKFREMLAATNMLQLVGHSGVGKSRLMKMFEEDPASEFSIHRELKNFEEWAAPSTDGKVKILFIDESNIEDQNFMMFAPLKAGGNRKVCYRGKIYELSEQHKVVFAHNEKSYGGGRVDQKLFEDGSIPEMQLADFPASYIYEMILKASIYDKLSSAIKSKVSLDDFKEFCARIIIEYQTNKVVEKDVTKLLTVRELQEKALSFIAKESQDLRWKKFETDKFTSTEATRLVEQELALTLRIRELQRDKDFPSEAVGVNGILIEGDSGTGKSQLIGSVLEGKKYHKIEASQSLEVKTRIIIEAFEKGEIVWIDELNSCIDDGLEKILNAALTGVHPDPEKKGKPHPGFTLVASINQISMEGRSAISPALLHRLKHQRAKSLQEYSLDDLVLIVNSWIKDSPAIEEEKRPLVAAAIARDFQIMLATKEGADLNLRTLKKMVQGEDFLKNYAAEVEHDEVKPTPTVIARRVFPKKGKGRKPNFKEVEEAIADFIDHELDGLADGKKALIDWKRNPEFLEYDKLMPHFTLDQSRLAGIKPGGANVTLDDWNGDVSNPYSYAYLRKIVLERSGYEKIFSFSDEEKTVDILAPLSVLGSIDPQIRKVLIACFPQFQATARVIDGMSLDDLKSDELLEREHSEVKEMSEIAGHEVIFTKAELEQELFFRSKDVKQAIPPVGNFDDLLQGSFCIGELHDHKSTKRIIIENVDELKKKGYGVVFLEGLVYDSPTQLLLDEYLAPASTRPMSDALKSILEKLDKGNGVEGSGYFEVVEAAKKAGMRVVGIESAYSATVPRAVDTKNDNKPKRCRDMNYAAKAIIEKESGGRPWVALMGSAHMKTIDGVPGVGEIMGVPSVYVYDSRKITRQAEARFSTRRLQTVESEARIACPATASLRFSDIRVTESTLSPPRDSSTPAPDSPRDASTPTPDSPRIVSAPASSPSSPKDVSTVAPSLPRVVSIPPLSIPPLPESVSIAAPDSPIIVSAPVSPKGASTSAPDSPRIVSTPPLSKAASTHPKTAIEPYSALHVDSREMANYFSGVEKVLDREAADEMKRPLGIWEYQKQQKLLTDGAEAQTRRLKVGVKKTFSENELNKKLAKNFVSAVQKIFKEFPDKKAAFYLAQQAFSAAVLCGGILNNNSNYWLDKANGKYVSKKGSNGSNCFKNGKEYLEFLCQESPEVSKAMSDLGIDQERFLDLAVKLSKEFQNKNLKDQIFSGRAQDDDGRDLAAKPVGLRMTFCSMDVVEEAQKMMLTSKQI